MAGDKVNNYSQIDSNILELQLTADKTFKGYHQLTLTEYDTTTVPAIAAGSAIECNGALYKFDTEEAISTTDPVTSAAVADGTVYVVIVPGATTCTAAFTATAPTWSDSKQGWYGTGGQANYRYVGGMGKSTTYYYEKFLYDKQSIVFLINYHIATDNTQRSTTASTPENETNLQLNFYALPYSYYRINLSGEFWTGSDSELILYKLKQTSGNGILYNGITNHNVDAYNEYILVHVAAHRYDNVEFLFYSDSGGNVNFLMEWGGWADNQHGYCDTRLIMAKII